ncbi:MAG TPA: PIN domain-containing protein [Pyrinomonadaceae bacterium]|nr:PIN domain-containing protein [Pyrinomonadaceae bacterium]
MIHLDTNFLIQALVVGSGSEEKLRTWVIADENVAISSIALSEFLCGPVSRDELALVETLLGPPEPFLATDASKAAELFNATGRRSRSLADCQIAAVALRCDANLATIKRDGFRAV